MTRTRHDDVDDVLRIIVRAQAPDPRIEAAPIATLYAVAERTIDALDAVGRLRPAGDPRSYQVANPATGDVVLVAGAQAEEKPGHVGYVDTVRVVDTGDLDALLDFVEHSMTTGTPGLALARKADDALRRYRPNARDIGRAVTDEVLVEAIGTLPTDGLDLGALGDAYDTIEAVANLAIGELEPTEGLHLRASLLLDAVRQAREEQDTAGLTVEAAVTDAMEVEHADPDAVIDAVIVDEAAYNALDTLLGWAEWHAVYGPPGLPDAVDTVRRHRDRLTRHVEDASPQREAPGLRASTGDGPPVDLIDLVRYPERIARVRYDLVERLLWHAAMVTGRPRAVVIAEMTRPPGAGLDLDAPRRLVLDRHGIDDVEVMARVISELDIARHPDIDIARAAARRLLIRLDG